MPTHLPPDPRAAIACEQCADWNRPHAPFRIHGDTYYVGTDALSAILITSKRGHVLLDAALPQSVAQIEANIRGLGFRVEDVKLIVNSHAHFDHAGGIAALAQDSGADVAASARGAEALRAGMPSPDDPQAAFEQGFAAVPAARAVADGETLRVGSIALTAHATPGHTPGSTAWSWRSCVRGKCVDVVYADSLTAVSAPGFRYAGAAGDAFRASIAKVETLPCDVVLSPHPGATRIFERAARDALVDADGCKVYAKRALTGLDDRLARE